MVERRHRGEATEAERYQRHGSSASKNDCRWLCSIDRAFFFFFKSKIVNRSDPQSHCSYCHRQPISEGRTVALGSQSIGIEQWVLDPSPLSHLDSSFTSLLVPQQRRRAISIPKRLSSATAHKRPRARPSALPIDPTTASRRSRQFLAAIVVPLIRIASTCGTEGSGSASIASARRLA